MSRKLLNGNCSMNYEVGTVKYEVWNTCMNSVNYELWRINYELCNKAWELWNGNWSLNCDFVFTDYRPLLQLCSGCIIQEVKQHTVRLVPGVVTQLKHFGVSCGIEDYTIIIFWPIQRIICTWLRYTTYGKQRTVCDFVATPRDKWEKCNEICIQIISTTFQWKLAFMAIRIVVTSFTKLKKVREKSRECHNHKPQPLLDTKRKSKQKKTKQARIEQTYEKQQHIVEVKWPWCLTSLTNWQTVGIDTGDCELVDISEYIWDIHLLHSS